MAGLFTNPDGIHFSAQAILAIVRDVMCDGIEESWSETFRSYEAQPIVSHYYEGHRTKGYSISMSGAEMSGRKIHFVFHRHSTSDDIVLFRFEGRTGGPIRPEDIPEDCDPRLFAHNAYVEVARIIADGLRQFWIETASK